MSTKTKTTISHCSACGQCNELVGCGCDDDAIVELPLVIEGDIEWDAPWSNTYSLGCWWVALGDWDDEGEDCPRELRDGWEALLWDAWRDDQERAAERAEERRLARHHGGDDPSCESASDRAARELRAKEGDRGR